MMLSMINRRLIFTLAAIMAVAILPNANGAPTLPKEGQFDQVFTVTTPRLSLKSTDRVTFKGAKFRLESTDPSRYTPYEDIEDGQSYYHFVPAEHAALRLDIKEKQVSPLDELHNQTLQMLQGAVKSGESTVNGFACDIYTRTLGPSTKITLYQSKDPRFPYIIRTLMVDSSDDTTRSNSIDNVKLDVPVSDSIFTLPKDTKIVEQPASADQSGTSSPPASPASVSK